MASLLRRKPCRYCGADSVDYRYEVGTEVCLRCGRWQ